MGSVGLEAFVWSMSTRNLALVALVALALGGLLRFVEIDRKIFWFNEIFTGLRISCEFESRGNFPELLTGAPVRPSVLTAYQVPDAEDGYRCIISSLASKDPANAPLYYFVARAWTDAFGFSPKTLRLLSAFAGLGLICAVGLLGSELFRDRRAGITAAALVAVSPIFLHYAQEARSYTLWLFFTVLACTFFLRALRTGKSRDWWLCMLLLLAALWTHFLTLSIVASFLLFLLLRDGPRLTSAAIRLVLVCGTAVALTAPLLLNLVRTARSPQGNLNHLSVDVEMSFMLERIGENFSHILLSWNAEASPWWLLALLPLGALFLAAFVMLWRRGPRNAFLFLLALALPPLAATLLPDLLLGGQRALRARYMFPVFVALLLALAHFLSAPSANSRTTCWLLPAVLLIGAVSSFHAVRSETWWGRSAVETRALDVLRAEPSSLIVTDGVYGQIAPLAHGLGEQAAFLQLAEPDLPDRLTGFSRYLLLEPGPWLLDAVTTMAERPPKLVFEMKRGDGRAFRVYRFVPRAEP